MAATRAHVLSAQENSKMRFFKNRPVLAVLLLVALVGVASGAAYAVDRVFLQVDPDETAPQIQQDITTQLQNAGVTAQVQASKPTANTVEVKIESADPTLPDRLDVSGLGGSADVEKDVHQIRIEPKGMLDEAQNKQFVAMMTTADVLAAMRKGDPAALKAAFEAHGFRDVTINDVNGWTIVSVAPPR
jgi:hypothetical protein